MHSADTALNHPSSIYYYMLGYCFLTFLSGLPQAGFGLGNTESRLVGSVLLLSPGLPAFEKKSTRTPAVTVLKGGGTPNLHLFSHPLRRCNLSNESKCIVCRDAPLEFLDLPWCPSTVIGIAVVPS